MFTDEEINKLPKWAQHRCKQAAANVEFWKTKAQEVAGDKDTNVFVQNYSDKNQPLYKNARILFALPKGVLTIYHVGDAIEVHAMSDTKRLAITPQISNGVQLRFI